MKKYRMLTTGAHDKLAATDFRGGLNGSMQHFAWKER